MEVNTAVVNGFEEFDVDPSISLTYAKPACLSVAMQALWTNRVPEHEPWPRVLKGDSDKPNGPNEESKQNVHHKDQFDNTTSPAGMEPIGKVEGTDVIERGLFWRR